PSRDQAAAACGRAIEASSRSASARIERAFVQASYAWQIVSLGAGEDPGPAIDEAITLATEAARLAPGEPMAPYVVGLGSSARGFYLSSRGPDSRDATSRAIAAYEGALRLDPTFVWALNDLASAYLKRAFDESFRGLDPAASIEEAVRQTERAVAID